MPKIVITAPFLSEFHFFGKKCIGIREKFNKNSQIFY